MFLPLPHVFMPLDMDITDEYPKTVLDLAIEKIQNEASRAVWVLREERAFGIFTYKVTGWRLRRVYRVCSLADSEVWLDRRGWLWSRDPKHVFILGELYLFTFDLGTLRRIYDELREIA